MLSRRFALPIAILLGLVLVPTITHSYLGATVDDGKVTEAVDSTLAGLTSRSTDRNAGWVKRTFDSDDWIERRYTGPNGSSVLLFVARSYDLKRLYHHPELAVLYGNDFDDGGIANLPNHPEVWVRQLKRRAGAGERPAAYALLYDGEFVDNPIALQLRTSFELMVQPRKPMTLFMVLDEHARSGAPFESSQAAAVLGDAITSFFSQ